jgi:TRAP-type C4-dicarboxylate transport system substrate-binding protein
MKSEIRRLGIASAALLPLILSFGGADPSRAASEPIKLTMVGAWPPGVSPAADIGIHFKDVVNRLAEGKLAIEFKGASDVIPTFDQPEALVRGVFDVWYGAPNYWAGVVPGGYVTELSSFEIPDKGPDSELFEFLVDMYAEHGVRYLGHFSGEQDTGNHFMYTQEEVSGIGDLKGLKIRVPPLTRFFVEEIGAEPVTLPPGEIYLALERGAVDGFTWPFFDGFTNFGWQEVSKYVILNPLYRDGTSINMNLEKWNSLPPDVQEIVLEAVRGTQEWAPGWVSEAQASQLADMKKGGMGTIEFSPEEAERWRETADAALWGHFESVMSPDEYATARRLLEAK